MRVTACEGMTLPLECPSGYHVVIKDAFYGRRASDVCPHDTAGDNLGCTDPNILRIIGDRCSAKNSCEIVVATRELGEPCFGTSKYLQLLWTCIRKS